VPRSALGLEKAGFSHTALVEIRQALACATLRHIPPAGIASDRKDMRVFKNAARKYRGIDLFFAGGLPCPPFSLDRQTAGRSANERNLFNDAIDINRRKFQPRAVMIRKRARVFWGRCSTTTAKS